MAAGAGGSGGAFAGAGQGGEGPQAGGGAGGQPAAGGTAGAGAAGGGAAGAGGTGGAAEPPNAYSEFASPVPLSPTEHDRFWSVTFDPQGRVYATGYLSAGNGDRLMAVTRFRTDGSPDPGFGTFGLATLNASVQPGGGREEARAVAIQSDGKVLVAGHAENPNNPSDRDGIIARFLPNGVLDSGFGVQGILRLDVNTSTRPTATADEIYDMKLDAQGRIVLFGSSEALDSRTDRDRFVARLTAEGAWDTSFNGTGLYSFDSDGLGLDDNMKNGLVQADGKVVSAGYTNVAGSNEIMLLRLNSDGTPDDTFGVAGLKRQKAFDSPGMAEAYAVGRQSTGSYVTTGYGRLDAGPQVDVVSLRFDSTGAWDAAGWGVQGIFLWDLASQSDRGRNMVVLPDDSIVFVGTAIPTGTAEDAMVMALTKDGALNPAFFNGAGYRLFDFGGADEEYFGAALSPDKKLLAAVGYRSGGQLTNDDALLLLLPLP